MRSCAFPMSRACVPESRAVCGSIPRTIPTIPCKELYIEGIRRKPKENDRNPKETEGNPRKPMQREGNRRNPKETEGSRKKNKVRRGDLDFDLSPSRWAMPSFLRFAQSNLELLA